MIYRSKIPLRIELAVRKQDQYAATFSSGGKLKPLSDYLLNAPSIDTPRIQEVHILLGHITCQLVEEKYFPN